MTMKSPEGKRLIRNRKAREARVVQKKIDAQKESTTKPLPPGYLEKQKALIAKNKKK